MMKRFSKVFRLFIGCSVVLLCAASMLLSGTKDLKPSDEQLSRIYGAGTYTGARCTPTGTGCMVSGNCGDPKMVVVNGVNVMGCVGIGGCSGPIDQTCKLISDNTTTTCTQQPVKKCCRLNSCIYWPPTPGSPQGTCVDSGPAQGAMVGDLHSCA